MAAETPIVVLEPAAQQLADATSKPPFLYELEPTAARKTLDDLQAKPINKLPIDEDWITVPSSVGAVPVRIVKPRGNTGTLPVVVYMHGGGWVLGNAATQDRLVRELAVGARAAIAFVEYTPSPEAHYPVAIEQGYATAQWIVRNDEWRLLRPVRHRLLPEPQANGVVLGRLHHRSRTARGDTGLTQSRQHGAAQRTAAHLLTRRRGRRVAGRGEAAIVQATAILRAALGTDCE